jgi:hypothetical protein
MALIIEDSQKVTQRKIPVPKNAQKVFSALYNALEPNMGKNNLKNLKNLATDKTYNKKGDNSDKVNGKEQGVNYVNIDVAKKRKERWPNNPLQQMAQGGQLAYDLYDKGIKRARSQEKVSPVEPPKPTSNATEPPEVKVKQIEMPSGTISYNENRQITEDVDEEHPYYDYMEEYDAYYVLSEFFNNPNGKEDWGVLINPEMYAKALREFTQYGKLVNFPSKYVYQWMGIIMKNTAILETNTNLAGHSMNFPGYEVAEFAEQIDGIEIGKDYSEGSKWLEEKGLYDWMEMPDGSDAWSDFGLEPLWKIFEEYDESLPPEKVLVLVNKALDVYHQRGDMASIFIQGGSKALSRIAEEIKRDGKKIYITEKQLINLKHG